MKVMQEYVEMHKARHSLSSSRKQQYMLHGVTGGRGRGGEAEAPHRYFRILDRSSYDVNSESSARDPFPDIPSVVSAPVASAAHIHRCLEPSRHH